MEIERKYLIDKKMLPTDYKDQPHSELEQAYIITDPVLRIRRKDDEYILTYKSSGLMSRQEIEMPLTKEAYDNLIKKTEGAVISKTRYRIPEKDDLTIELDIFHKAFEGLILAEVEFPDEDMANAYIPPTWFSKDVTMENTFHNSRLSSLSENEISELLSDLKNM